MSVAVNAVPEARAIWLPAYVGIGSNLDNPEVQVRTAFERLATLPNTRMVARSSLYRSQPLGEVVQPAFVNAVAGLLTQLSPEMLLVELRKVEIAMGRAPPRERWGPRRIDLDLLVLGSEQRATPSLTVPHPGISQRDFVLLPFCEIAPDAVVPGVASVRALRAAVSERGIELLAMTGAAT